METVNALKIRNQLGEVLDRLNATGEPILVSRGRKVQAVLVTLDDFEKRFLDVRAEEEKRRFLERLRGLRRKRSGPESSQRALRALRGYPR